jgi:hypothetical protein
MRDDDQDEEVSAPFPLSLVNLIYYLVSRLKPLQQALLYLS